MKFYEAIEIILKSEGGYVDDKQDPGGETKFGISRKSFPFLDIKNLTRDAAIAIYKKNYWDALELDSLHEGMRLIVFDCAVNQGPNAALAMLRKVFDVKDTKSAFEICDQIPDVGVALSKYAYFRLMAYRALPAWGRFGVGWAARLLDVSIRSALAMPKK